jgi:hypothetical protein
MIFLLAFWVAVIVPSWAVEAEGSAIQVEGASVLTMKRWSPYAAGFGIGTLSWIAFLLMGKGLGASSSFVKTSGMIEKIISKENVKQKAYYQEVSPRINSGWMLVAGIFAGSFLSSKLSGDFHLSAVPPLWEAMFGANVLIRLIVAFIGGIILIIGARWAGGCTSGHGITGTLQLAMSSWMALIAFFVGGVVTAYLIFSWA